MKTSAGTMLYQLGPQLGRHFEPRLGPRLGPQLGPSGSVPDATGGPPVQTGRPIRVLLVHMGGPFWSHKDEHAWSIPKGEYTEGEDPRQVAAREFAEELGSPLPDGPEIDLGLARQSGKTVLAFARFADFDAASCVSNSVTMTWPPGSGRQLTFPEVDRAQWFDLPTARSKLVKGQVVFLDRLAQSISNDFGVRPGAVDGLLPEWQTGIS